MLQFRIKPILKRNSILHGNQLPKISYDSTLRLVTHQKANLRLKYHSKTIDIDSVGNAFTKTLLNQIIPYWLGTSWDFNGYTAKPKQGNIACGYFVSTTLLHAGCKLNRYKMAQKAAMEEALILEPKDSLFIRYTNRSKFIKEFIAKSKNGIYLIGLSFHVGYLYKSGNEVLFIHSNYINRQGVIVENAYTSEALEASDIFVVADLTNNNAFLKKWLNDIEIK